MLANLAYPCVTSANLFVFCDVLNEKRNPAEGEKKQQIMVHRMQLRPARHSAPSYYGSVDTWHAGSHPAGSRPVRVHCTAQRTDGNAGKGRFRVACAMTAALAGRCHRAARRRRRGSAARHRW